MKPCAANGTDPIVTLDLHDTKQMKHPQSTIPDEKQCRRIMDQWDMLPHIRRHSIMVCRVALAIARSLNKSGVRCNIDEIRAAALLHDITKTKSLETGENHALTGSQLVARLGYPRIADIILQHIHPDDGGADITSEEIVSYADKRVLHETVVSLDTRFAYLTERYGKDKYSLQRIDASRGRTRSIEEKITALITLPGFDIHRLQLTPEKLQDD